MASLILLAVMRIAEAIKTRGRYFWVTRCTQPGKATERLPNLFQLVTGRHIWKAHFKSVFLDPDPETMTDVFSFRGEGKEMVLSRGMAALVFLVLLLGFAFTTIIIDPLHESNEVPVRVGMSSREYISPYAGLTVVVVSTETPKMKSSVTKL